MKQLTGEINYANLIFFRERLETKRIFKKLEKLHLELC